MASWQTHFGGAFSASMWSEDDDDEYHDRSTPLQDPRMHRQLHSSQYAPPRRISYQEMGELVNEDRQRLDEADEAAEITDKGAGEFGETDSDEMRSDEMNSDMMNSGKTKSEEAGGEVKAEMDSGEDTSSLSSSDPKAIRPLSLSGGARGIPTSRGNSSSMYLGPTQVSRWKPCGWVISRHALRSFLFAQGQNFAAAVQRRASFPPHDNAIMSSSRSPMKKRPTYKRTSTSGGIEVRTRKNLCVILCPKGISRIFFAHRFPPLETALTTFAN